MAVDVLSILLLGSPSITWQDKPFQMARRQVRALLYRLAVSIEPVPRQQLCFLFWPDLPEAQARRNLNRLLSYLHQTLPDREILALSDETISLNPHLTWSDADEFQNSLQNEQTTGMQRAIDLYRGSFLHGFYLPHSPEYDFWLTEERERFERRYLDLLAKQVEALMDAGDFQQAIPYAQNYLKIDNLAEELHRRVIVCQAALGNRAAAKAQYEQMVITLERELGVPPLPETVSSYESSLTGIISSLRTVPTPQDWSIMPSLNIPMVGRSDSWQALAQGYQKFKHGGILLISGEAGIGKSRILKEFATHTHRYVINGSAYPSTQSYQPILQALQVALPHKWLWQGIPSVWVAELSLILPDLSTYFPDLPVRISLDPGQAQARMFEALARVFFGLADQAKPLLFCLDDLHWADEMTLGWLEYLAPRLPHSNLCVLATYRSEDADALIELRRVLSRTDVSSEVILNGLEQNAVSQMVDASGVAQWVQTGWIPKLHQATDGNPFFILEILSEVLTQEGEVDSEILPVSRNIHTIISGRLSRLSILARQVLEACAVLAPQLELELIGATSGRQEFELVEALDELTRQNLLKAAGSAYLFRHDLIRQAIYQGLSQMRCQLLHKRAAAAIETVYVKSIQNESALIAFHYDRAARASPAVEYYHAAARSARAIYAYQAAVSYLQRAIELLPASGHPDDFVAGLYDLLGDCYGNMGNFVDARDSYNRAIQILGRDKPFLTASLLRKCAAAFGGEFNHDQALPLLDLAVELLESYPDDEALAWQHTWLDVQLERMFLYYQKALPEKIDEISSQIQPILAKSGTPLQRIRFLTGLNYSAVRKNRYRVSREIVDSERYALQVAKEVGDSALICERQFNTGILCLLYGDLQSAIEYLAAGLELSRKIGLHPIELQCLIYLIAAQRMLNNLPEVEGLVTGCMEIAQLVGNPNYIGAALAHQAWLAFRSGKFDTARELALQALEQWQKTRTYPFQWMGLWLLLALAYVQKDDSLMLQTAAALVHPLQQAAPSELEDLLQSAINAGQDQEIEKARRGFDNALHLARLFGYL